MEQRIKFPRSQKVYLPGKLYPNIRVAMRKVEQVPSVSFEGEEKIATPNPEVYVYDTSGPFSDTEMNIDLKKGLPRMREEWIVSRGDVERLPEITSEYGRMRSRSTTCALNISLYLIVPKKEKLLPKWRMRKKE